MEQNNHAAQLGQAEQLFCARIEDMARQLHRDAAPCFSRFLDEREQALAQQTLHRLGFGSDRFCFWAGFDCPPTAPGRRMLGLFPDYLALSEGITSDIWEEQFPICSLTLRWRRQDAVTHRDILGSLMGLDFKRELVGEILVGEDHAVLFCTPTAARVIERELSRVGRVGVQVQTGFQEPLPPAFSLEYHSGTVSSMRLDCVVAMMLSLSREKSAALIEGGQVNLNFLEEQRCACQLRQGDILSVRGHGRFVVWEIGSSSKKGRLHLTVGRYI